MSLLSLSHPHDTFLTAQRGTNRVNQIMSCLAEFSPYELQALYDLGSATLPSPTHITAVSPALLLRPALRPPGSLVLTVRLWVFLWLLQPLGPRLPSSASKACQHPACGGSHCPVNSALLSTLASSHLCPLPDVTLFSCLLIKS